MRRLAVFTSALLLFGCPKAEEEILCPQGTIREGSVCVRPDTGVPDSGDVADTGAPDTGAPDTGELVDGGNQDSGAIDAGAEAATISTDTLDFGGALIGTAVKLSFTIENRTMMDVVVNAGALSGTNPLEFTATATPAIANLTLRPGQQASVSVDYTPTIEGPVSAFIPVSLCEDGCNIDVIIRGIGLLEAIDCQPAAVNFGFVNPGACASRDVECENVSSYPAEILAWSLVPGSATALQVSASTTTPVTLAGGNILTFTVDYCPTGFTNDSGTIAVSIVHPNPVYTTKAIPLSGTGGGADISCTLSVDFGITGVSQTIQRTATCTNIGNVPLQISSALFEAGTTTELFASFSLNGSPATVPIALQPSAALDIDMTFAPLVAGTHTTSFIMMSNDLDTPEVRIAVTAQALDTNGCTIQIAPAAIDFGAVAPGVSSEAAAVVSNTGTGPCAVTVLGLGAGTAPEFTLVGGAQSVNLAPGGALPVRARFEPAAEVVYTGSIEIDTTDLVTPMRTIALTGQGLSPFASVRPVPASIDFGQVQAGCTNAATQVLRLENNSGAPRTVTVTLEAGAAPELAIMLPSANPITIPNGGSIDVDVSFMPGAAGSYSGRVQIVVVGGPTIYVPLDGEGIATPQTTVTFPGQATPELDLLIVIDDSCSMSEEQARLAAVAPTVIARGDAAGVQYHIGVTTTDGSPGIAGTLRGTPRVVTWTSATRSAQLQANINQGVNGSGIEEGLRTATEAVTDVTLLQTTNAGFLRPNAELVILILSDEDDQSGGAPPFTPVAQILAQLSNRPIGAPGTPRIYTITGGLVACPTAIDPAPRYIDAATQTGGFDRSICLPDYTPIVTEISDQIFAPSRTRFQLGATPVSGSVTVRVNGVVVPATDYGLDFTMNEVVFLPGNAPLVSETVAIDYSTMCVLASCGNATPNAGEQCDDGNPVNTDACLDTCYNAYCGDLFIRTSVEQCDDGNNIAGDGCNGLCTIEGCGNGILEPPEECDNGAQNSNTVPNACRTSCLSAFCGDLVPDTGEQCDDGNDFDTDACVACATAFCGDGFTQQGVEECDDGNLINTDACDNNCTSNLINFVVTNAAQALVPAAGNAIAATDESVIAVPIGFPFSYLGVAVMDVGVGSNGFVSFDAFAGNSFTNVSIPNAAPPNTMVAWWWDDLDPGRFGLPTAPEVRTSLSGAAPNRVRTITYVNIPRFATGTGILTAEVRLRETINVIEVHYGAIADPQNNTTWGASVGWESQGGTRGAAVLPCTPGCGETMWPTDTIYTYTPQ